MASFMYMGHQIVFYLGPADSSALEARLRGAGGLLVLHSRSDRPAPRILGSTDFREGAKPWLFYHLVRPDDVGSIDLREVSAQAYWAVDVLTSPVVELSRCYFDGRVLRRGRLYYTEGFYGAGGHWVEKPREFTTWAKRLLAAARKTLTLDRQLSAYVGAEAEELRASGLVQFTAL